MVVRRLVFFVFTSVVACSQNPAKPLGQVVEPYSTIRGSVSFDIKQGDQLQGWFATYTADGKTAKFRIDLGIPKGSQNKYAKISFGTGRFLCEPDSDADTFLHDLARTLEAKKIPRNARKAAALPFDYVILGTHQSRSADGGFADSPSGNWIAMKVFLGNDEGEVFLNLNPTLGKGEFSIKDSDFGDFVVAKLATIL